MEIGDDGVILRSSDNIGRSVPWFREEMARNDVPIGAGTALGKALKQLETLRDRALSSDPRYGFSTTTEAYLYFTEAYGADLLTKALHAGCSSGLRIPPARWRYLISGDPIPTRRSPRSLERDLTWETILAALIATFASDVDFTEPDVRCTFSGKPFAVAAKVLYSMSKLRERIKEGADQSRDRGEAALVMVNTVELFPHQTTPPEMLLRWSRARARYGAANQAEIMKDAVGRWVDNNFDLARIVRDVRPRVVKPIGVAFFVPMLLHYREQPVPNLYTHMPVTWQQDRGPDFAFTKAFLHACNTVPGFGGGPDW